jgi:hypothetical protein
MYVGTTDCQNCQRMSALPTQAHNCASQRARRRRCRRTSELPTVRTFDERQNCRQMLELPTSTVTARASDWTSAVLAWVSTSDRREFWHTSALQTPKATKTILRAREVLECLSYDLALILEHSIFLRPTKFASLFIVRHSLDSRSNIKEFKCLWVHHRVVL